MMSVFNSFAVSEKWKRWYTFYKNISLDSFMSVC